MGYAVVRMRGTMRPSGAAAPAGSPVEAARALGPAVRAAAARVEQDRRLPPELVAALAEAGLFRLCVPRALGGLEADPGTLVETLATLAEADGSTAWCVMIGATTGVLAAWVSDDVAREVWGPAGAVTGGAFAPQGRAVAVDGGWRVTGRWAFASGCQHCAWLTGGSVLMDGDRPRLLPSGAPDARLMLFPAAEVEVIDTWTVSGLRGTGSHDIAVADAFVPAARSVSLVTDRPRATGPLYAFPVFGLLALGIAAVGLGMARAALDELRRLAGVKTPALARRLLRDRPVVQVEVARAEAALGAARAFVLDAVGAAWETARARGAMSLDERVRLRLAATGAAQAAARVVDAAYEAGGGTSIYATSPLQRCFRDVHALTQHTMVAPATLELAGRVLLGVETDAAML
jgi:alkylation response protein AidB-like acyl-CoA dehydrogenase